MHISPESELRRLEAAHPLPPGWSKPRLFFERADVLGVEIGLVGLVSACEDGTDVSGSAADVDGMPVERAYYELLERATVSDAAQAVDRLWQLRDAQGKLLGMLAHSQVFLVSPDFSRWQYSLSNGVALSTNWTDACARACKELAERDLILRAWYGALVPEPVPLAEGTIPKSWREAYDFAGYRIDMARGYEAVWLIGFPRQPELPLVFGSAADTDTRSALHGAMRECIQRLGFLWGESLPDAEPSFSPTAGYHQEYYLNPGAHQALREWLAGRHCGETAEILRAASSGRASSFASLTSREDDLHVVKCIPDAEIPLVFGQGHPLVRLPRASPLAVHPIA